MAVGWARDGAEQDEIDAAVRSEINRVRSELAGRESFTHCEDCGEEIPEARRRAVPGVRRCVQCQAELDGRPVNRDPYNRRGSKGSQMR